jgi:hypothetical protein
MEDGRKNKLDADDIRVGDPQILARVALKFRVGTLILKASSEDALIDSIWYHVQI